MSVPQILIIDDEPDRVMNSFGLEIASKDAELIIRHPQNVAPDDLCSCTLIVVDHYLDNWPERDIQRVSMKPANGSL